MINRLVISSKRIARSIRGFYAEPIISPVFILGNQKSGTTAIAASLAHGTEKSVALDLFSEMSKPTFNRVVTGNMTFPEFIRRNRLDFCKQIIKEPHLSLLADQLVDHYPESRYLFICRDPRDNIRSILNRLHMPGDREILREEDYQRLTKTWRLTIDSSWLGFAGSNYIESLSYRWEATMRAYARHSKRMVLLRYEDFRSDPERTTIEVASQLDLEITKDISDVVKVQYQPRGESDVDLDQFFGQRNLQRISKICESAHKYGYA